MEALQPEFVYVWYYFELQLRRICGYRVSGYGCGTPSMTARSRYPNEAYQLGKSL